MKSAITFCVLFFFTLALVRPGDEHYTDRFDNINLDEIMSNKKFLASYINCLLDKGKCTPVGKELRDNLKEAIETDCFKCTEAQKKGSKHVIKYLINNEEANWNELTTKYDPDNNYFSKHEKKLHGAYRHKNNH